MGFFLIKPKTQKQRSAGRNVSVDLLHKLECKACPLQATHGQLTHPDMRPTGSKKPLVYVLGEAPGADEDQQGRQFVGKAGRVLRSRIPDDWDDHIRWNNCVRTRPPGNKTPEFTEIECCRPSVVRDIEQTKPRAIFGFGNVPLGWAINQSGITKWTMRYLPLRVGNHTCWYFPMLHPSYINRIKHDKERGAGESEAFFERNLHWAFDIVEKLPEPIVHTKDDALAGVEFVTGGDPDDKDTVIKFLDYCDSRSAVGSMSPRVGPTSPQGRE